ncbi:protein roadkill-like [Culex quinquefasciatus]|uniref:protein roadkill-like n=1 Tax=Culex quinquefasciatus TaxID=7176 RepID=UPI0018E2BD92|nr:protein roadkill-like [Culex quinquefasciatus]
MTAPFFHFLELSAYSAAFVYFGYKLVKIFLSDEQTCRTVQKSKTYTNTWTIRKFDTIRDSSLKSVVFSGTTCDGEYVAWSYMLNPGYNGGHWASIKIQCESENKAQDVEITIEGITEKFFGAISKGTFQFPRSKLLELCSYWTGSLTLRFKVTFTKNVLEGCSYEKSISFKEPPQSTLAKDYADLLSSNQSSDITVKVGQRTFHAHKVVFIARSKVFAAMFQHDMQEAQQNQITIPDMDADVFEEVLRYIYTDSVERLPGMAYELLEAAEKYDLTRLKVLCEIELLAGITAKSATKTLEFADLYRADELKARTLQFIARNLSEIPNWKEFCSAKPDLVAEVLDEIARGNHPKALKVNTTEID